MIICLFKWVGLKFYCHLHNWITACANPSLKRKSTDESQPAPASKKKPLTNERREERNLREKERSLKITQQIHELRSLLSAGGVIVPKVSVLITIGVLI